MPIRHAFGILAFGKGIAKRKDIALILRYLDFKIVNHNLSLCCKLIS